MASLTGIDAPIFRFSSDLSDLAVATGDGRVKIFNVAQQKLRADITQALSGSKGMDAKNDIHSCLDWSKQNGSEKVLFLGTTAGEVKCFDTARAELRWSVFAAVDGAIAAVAVGPSGRVLIVGKSGAAAILDPVTGAALHRLKASKQRLSAGALLDSSKALIAGSAVSLFDISTEERLAKWTGHATPVTALQITPDGSYFCTAAEGERQVAVWSLELTKAGKLKHKSAVARLNLEQPAISLAIAAAIKDSFNVAAVTSSGALSLFECSVGADGQVEAVKWASTAPALKGGALVAALTAVDADGAGVAVASGSIVKPTFQTLRVERSAAGGVSHIELGPSEAGMLLGTSGGGATTTPGGAKQPSARSGQEPSSVLGAAEGAILAGKLSNVAGGKRPRDNAVQDDVAGMDIDAGEDDLADMDDEQRQQVEEEELTFAQRLAALQQAQEDNTEGGKTSAAKSSKADKAAAAALEKGPIKADSLAVLLTQALQSGDKAMLERCLTVRKEDIINNTVKRLSPGDAAAFLRAMVLRLQSSPKRGEQLATWIRATLLYHTAYLAGVAGMSGTLGYLYQLIEARLASYQPLVSLNGRLDIVISNARRAAEGGVGYGGAANGPLVAVEVGSDGAIEVEDAFAAAGLSDDEDYTSDEESSDAEDADLANGMGGSSDEDDADF